MKKLLTSPQAILFYTSLAILCCFASFDGLYGQDAYEYLRYTNRLKAFFLEGSPPGDYFWPVYYPLLGSILSILVGHSAFALQLLSLLALATTAVYLYKTILFFYPDTKHSFTYTVLFFLLSPYAFKLGLIAMSDMLTTAFISSCFYYCFKYLENNKPSLLYLAIALATSAIMSRYVAIVVLFPLALYIFYAVLKNKHTLHLLALAILFFILCLPHFYLKTSAGPTAFLSHEFLKEWSIVHFLQSAFTTQEGHINTNTFPNIIYALSSFFHARYVAFGSIFLIVLVIKKAWHQYNYILLASILLYAFFLAGIPRQNSRFLLLSFPFILILFYPAFNSLLLLIKHKNIQYSLLLFIALLQLGLCIYSMQPVLKRNALEIEIAQALKPYQANTLYAFDMDIALQGRALNFDYQNLWTKEYEQFTKGSYVLFNVQKLAQQWEGKNPMINWHALNNNYELQTIKTLNDGWVLYQISAD